MKYYFLKLDVIGLTNQTIFVHQLKKKLQKLYLNVKQSLKRKSYIF